MSAVATLTFTIFIQFKHKTLVSLFGRPGNRSRDFPFKDPFKQEAVAMAVLRC